MLTALIFIIVLGVLVLVHEFGHFIFAKRAGMKVEEFGLGFPPRLWGKKKGETTYSLNWIPFGGFVKIYGEEGEHANEPRSFTSKPVHSRMIVVVAGVVMNFLFAVFLLVVGNYLGVRIGLDNNDSTMLTRAKDKLVQIVEVVDGSPAQKADLKVFDEVVGFKTADGQLRPAISDDEVRKYVGANAGKVIDIVIKRDGLTFEKSITVGIPNEKTGALGIVPVLTGIVSYPWYEAVWRGTYDAVMLAWQTVAGYAVLLKTLITQGRLIADISGPIGIASLTGKVARIGFIFLIQFVALISVNLAVLNIIPFPALDGGRAALLIVEKIKGSPVGRKTENLINSVGFALLIMLMVYATIHDITKFF